MGHHWLLPLAAALADLVIGAGVLVRSRVRDTAAWTFAAMSASMASWNLGLAALHGVTSGDDAELLSRLARVGICFAPVTTYHVVTVLADYRNGPWRHLLVAGYSAGILLAGLNLAGLLVSGVSPHTWGWYPNPTPLYGALTALIITYPALCVVLMLRRHRNPVSARQRAQVGCWFIAGLVQIPLVVTNLLGIYGHRSYPLGSLGNVAFLAIIAYAIVRHRFLDVDWLVRKAIGFSLASVLVLVPGAAMVAGLASRLGATEPLPIACAAAALGLLGAAVVPALQRGIETRVQRVLFAERWDERRRLRELARDLVHELNEQRLLQRLGDTLAQVLDLEACAVFARDEQTRRLAPVHGAGTSPQPLDDGVVSVIEPLAGPMLVDELEAAAPRAAAALRAAGWAVVVPLRANDRLGGLALLGQNRDLRLVSAEDLNLLDTVAAAAGVALANARLSQELRRSEAVLQRATRLSSLGVLAAGIAHEIRNPLVAVKTFLDLLPQRLDDPDFVRSFRELSLNELRRVTDLISDLLALGRSSRMERGEVELVPALEPVIRLMDTTARKRQVALDAQLAAGIPAVWADADQVKQITLNLILNAIEASPPDTTVTVEAGPTPDGGAWLLVRDQGCGIPADQLDGIFEPFFTTKESGTGLGLSLVHQMVVEHGGDIAVESTPGHGTCFRVRLPGAAAGMQRTGS